MNPKSFWIHAVAFIIAILCSFPLYTMAQQEGDAAGKKLSKEELAQLLAPIALYPDELVSQILIGSTYPLEIVQADRWVKSHKQSAGDALAKQLEKEPWDPSVKSLVNFPVVLAKMSEKLDLTTQIGDAFLSQQQDVMETIQELRKKAYEAGNLKTTKEQKVVVEQETIVIKPASPEVVYVPSYSPTVVYGAWPYPAYPPYYYYPPPPPAYPAYHFAAGVAVGVAWGYAWGNCNWNRGEVNYNVNQNINVNRGINRSQYARNTQGRWQHNPQHRKNVAYRNSATAQRYGQSTARAAGSRTARGYAAGGAGTTARTGTATGTARRDSAFSGSGSGRQERMASARGQASRQSSSFSGGASRGGGGFGGGGRGFGGGGRGGGRR